MSNSCQDCNRLQIKTVGTAPERPQFQQPTKYDHYNNFQKFKHSKKEEQFINQRKEELLKFNPNFTDFHLNRVLTKDEFEQFSTQDIAKFRQQLRLGNCDHNSNSFDCMPDRKEDQHYKHVEEDNENDRKSLQKRKSLLSLTRTPVQCPISICNRTLGVTFVLSHFLRDHNEDFGVPCQEIYAEKPSVLIFDPTNLDFHENVCLGILAYGGHANDSSSRPTERGLCINNAFLPKPYEHLTSHLPILIMACRTSWSTLLNIKDKLKGNIHNPNSINQELLVIWLASVQTVRPIYCTVTVYDKEMVSSRSLIMQIRDLNHTQNPEEFMLKETNCMRLSHGEINILTQSLIDCINMEILINEF
ncbi:hypothetical protein FF38_10194 [Lucilia cuprina]|uniref:DUF4729 domain-containing protein n=1 Tax=Lucilia cuprina TaxID=7375 RepID=A0A0L0CNZ7_LUCCU|nr:hypothetical protein CVS40_9607 [Lucilia cuprina]KNC33996.1 hypothetical protein FF38_10194 [Lucilia cuprina]